MTTATTDQEFLSVPQTARLLGVPQTNVLAWIHRKLLPASDVSAGAGLRPRWRIKRADLDRFLSRRSTSPPRPTQRRRARRADGIIEFYK